MALAAAAINEYDGEVVEVNFWLGSEESGSPHAKSAAGSYAKWEANDTNGVGRANHDVWTSIGGVIWVEAHVIELSQR